MASKVRATFPYIVVSSLICVAFYHRYLHGGFVADQFRLSAAVVSAAAPNDAVIENITAIGTGNYAARKSLITDAAVNGGNSTDAISMAPAPLAVATAAILLPYWEVLVIVSLKYISGHGGYFCKFETDELSPANYYGALPLPPRETFVCLLPPRARRKTLFQQLELLKSPEDTAERGTYQRLVPSLQLLEWSYLVYDSLTTEFDVVLFVKGVNDRQGNNRDPKELQCVFGDGRQAITTDVTSSTQEVLRCRRPELTITGEAGVPVKATVQMVTQNEWLLLPSVAHCTPPLPRRLASPGGKSLLCATTMVYNVAKFLKEWVIYHSKIGVDKFLLYDNGSDDDLGTTVDELVEMGFNVTTYFWPWPKTQEAGFSHVVLYARNACTWMMYTDVDEFLYSPSWHNSSQPSPSLLHSLILTRASNIGQFNIKCCEFGSSGQRQNPAMGVMQGYTCRRRRYNRHKSIVLLESVDDSLFNAVHHFAIKPGYMTKKVSSNAMVVNHYKYQAWPEFRNKFRRRVSTYVPDWTQKSSLKSHDRVPGLGAMTMEPKGWHKKFCQLEDYGLRNLSWNWFGMVHKMAWQR